MASNRCIHPTFDLPALTHVADRNRQIAFVGFTNPQSPNVESPEEVRDAILEASKYIAVDQLGATDDCGFSPFSIDVKPKHGSPDFARDIAFQKIANRIKGASMAREQLSK